MSATSNERCTRRGVSRTTRFALSPVGLLRGEFLPTRSTKFRFASLVALTTITLLGVWVFHLGWRSGHPGVMWPIWVILSLVSAIVAMLGLVLSNWPIVVAGASGWLFVRVCLAHRDTTE